MWYAHTLVCILSVSPLGVEDACMRLLGQSLYSRISAKHTVRRRSDQLVQNVATC